MKQDWLKQGYRKWFAQLDEEVPEDVWAAIEDELDIDEVWAGINDELSPRHRRSPWGWVARAAAVFLLLFSCLAAYKYLFNPEAGTERTVVRQEMPGPPLPGTDNSPDRNEFPDKSDSPERNDSPGTNDSKGSFPRTGGSIARDNSTKPNAPGTNTHRKSALARNTGDLTVVPLTERDINSIPAPSGKPFLSLVQAPPSDLHDVISAQMQRQAISEAPESEGARNGIASAADETAASPDKEPFIRLQQLGLVSAYSNTWMLNHETFNGLQSSTLNATTATYGASNGINAGLLIRGKHRLGAELYFSSRTGQRYQQYIEARYQSRNIQLDYYKLQLFYLHPVFAGRADVLTGAYASYLKKGREEIAGEAHAIGRYYRDIDYGLMAGFQVNLPINNKLQLHPGVRVNYGLPNIFKGNQLIPDNFLRTHNAGIGFQLGFSYKLSE